MTAAARSWFHAPRLERRKKSASRVAAEPFDLARVAVAGQEPQRGQRHVAADRGDPGRSEDLQQRVQPGHRGGPPVHQPGADLHRPLERLAGTEGVLTVQPVGVQQRQPGQHLGVQPVGLGVLVVVGPQVGGLLRGDHHHGRAVAAEPRRQRHPGVAGRFHHHHHLGGVGGQLAPQRVELVGVGAEPMTDPQHHAVLVGARRLVGGAARHVDPQPDLHELSLARGAGAGAPGGPHRKKRIATDIRYQGSGLEQVAGHRVLNRARVLECGARPPPRSTGKESKDLPQSEHQPRGSGSRHHAV